MPEPKKYYYYNGKKLFLNPDTKMTSVYFKGPDEPSPNVIKSYSKLISYSPREKVAVFGLSERRTRTLFKEKEKQLGIFPVYNYSRKILDGYRPIILNTRFFARFIDNYSAAMVKVICLQNNFNVLERIEGELNLYHLEYPIGDNKFLDRINQFYEQNKEVVMYAHPDFVSGVRTEAGNDLSGDQKPVLDQLKVTQTWAEIQTKNLPLNEIKVAVLDEGIKHTHPDLGSATVPLFFDCYAGDPRPYDNTNGHGTAVAGIISAVQNNQFITGVAYTSKLIDVRISLTDGGIRETSNYNIVQGIQFAIAQNARVINISFSHPFSTSIEDKIKEALNNKIVVCCAAGNYYPDETLNVLFPGTMGGYTDVITVAACNESNVIIDYNSIDKFGSRRGPAVTVIAPGRNIVTLGGAGLLNSINNFKGTSASTAFISGIAALLLAIDPTKSPFDIKKILKDNAGPNLVADAFTATIDLTS